MRKTLLNIGLSLKEIDVYLLLLEMGQLPLSRISNLLKIGSSTAQYVCNSLIEKQIISRVKNSGNTFYLPQHTNKILGVVSQWQKIAESELMEYRLKTKEIPQVTVVSDANKTLEMYDKFWNMVPRGATVYGHVSLLPMKFYDFTMDVWRECIKKRKERNIFYNIICEESELAHKMKAEDKGKFRESVIVNSNVNKLASFEIIACEQVTFEFTYDRGENYLSILGTSPAFSMAKNHSLKTLWNLLKSQQAA